MISYETKYWKKFRSKLHDKDKAHRMMVWDRINKSIRPITNQEVASLRTTGSAIKDGVIRERARDRFVLLSRG